MPSPLEIISKQIELDKIPEKVKELLETANEEAIPGAVKALEVFINFPEEIKTQDFLKRLIKSNYSLNITQRALAHCSNQEKDCNDSYFSFFSKVTDQKSYVQAELQATKSLQLEFFNTFFTKTDENQEAFDELFNHVMGRGFYTFLVVVSEMSLTDHEKQSESFFKFLKVHFLTPRPKDQQRCWDVGSYTFLKPDLPLYLKDFITDFRKLPSNFRHEQFYAQALVFHSRYHMNSFLTLVKLKNVDDSEEFFETVLNYPESISKKNLVRLLQIIQALPPQMVEQKAQITVGLSEFLVQRDLSLSDSMSLRLKRHLRVLREFLTTFPQEIVTTNRIEEVFNLNNEDLLKIAFFKSFPERYQTEEYFQKLRQSHRQLDEFKSIFFNDKPHEIEAVVENLDIFLDSQEPLTQEFFLGLRILSENRRTEQHKYHLLRVGRKAEELAKILNMLPVDITVTEKALAAFSSGWRVSNLTGCIEYNQRRIISNANEAGMAHELGRIFSALIVSGDYAFHLNNIWTFLIPHKFRTVELLENLSDIKELKALEDLVFDYQKNFEAVELILFCTEKRELIESFLSSKGQTYLEIADFMKKNYSKSKLIQAISLPAVVGTPLERDLRNYLKKSQESLLNLAICFRKKGLSTNTSLEILSYCDEQTTELMKKRIT